MESYLRDQAENQTKLEERLSNEKIDLSDSEQCLQLSRRLKSCKQDRELVTLDLSTTEITTLSQFLLVKRLVKTSSIIYPEMVNHGLFHSDYKIRILTLKILIKLKQERGISCSESILVNYLQLNNSRIQDWLQTSHAGKTMFVNGHLLEPKYGCYLLILSRLFLIDDSVMLTGMVDLFSDDDDKLFDILLFTTEFSLYPLLYFLDSIDFDCAVLTSMIDGNIDTFLEILQNLTKMDTVLSESLVDYDGDDDTDYYYSFKSIILELGEIYKSNEKVCIWLERVDSLLI